MPLKKSKGNMYNWVTNQHAHLGGSCLHDCSYCYVKSNIYKRNPDFVKRYSGFIRLIEKEFDTNYGKGKTIFIEHMNDLFAENVPDEFIVRILEHCKKWPENIYVYQTKNPARYFKFLNLIPKNSILGTTIETNRDMSNVSKAPSAKERYEAMKILQFRKFVTSEPILRFDIEIMPIQHKKNFGVYHWDTFDNTTFLMDEADTFKKAEKIVQKKYGDRLSSNGADQVDIVDKKGNVVKIFHIC